MLTNKQKIATVEITDFDIATIEALHDLLLDKCGYSYDFITLVNARKLISKIYEASKMNKDKISKEILIKRMERIAADMEEDARNFYGKPFNGETLAEYFGHQGAAIAALAFAIKLLIVWGN